MRGFSRKLLGYIKKVGDETGLRVLIEKTGDLGLPGMASGFVEGAGIIVRLSPELHGRQMEQSIAHEITHGLLRCKKGFPHIVPMVALSEKEALSLSILSSMLEDIPANKITYAEGFPLFASNYLETVEKEEKDIIRGEYFSSVKDAHIRKMLMIARCVTAWGFLEYFDIDIRSRKILEGFIRSFDMHYQQESEQAGRIKDIIKRNDIFTSGGYDRILRACLKLWGLYDLIKLRVAE